jgi:acyl carrier protein
VLGLEDPLALDRQQGFFQLGMDSVMSVRVRNQLEISLARELPSTLAFDHPSVDALAAHLARELGVTAPVAGPAATASLDDLSAAELEALLAAELEGAP